MGETLQVRNLERAEAIEASVALRPMATLRSALVWDSLSYFGSKVVPGVMGLASVPIFIRMVGLDEYGRFAVIVPLLMAVAAASSGWLAQGILRFHPLATDLRGRQIIFDRAVNRGTVASVLLTASALFLMLAGLHYAIAATLISGAFCLSLLIYTVMLAKFQAQLRPGAVLRREIIRSTGGFLFPVVIVAITRRKHFELLILGQAIAYTIAFLPGLLSQNDANHIVPGIPGELASGSSSIVEVIRQLWRFGWAVGLWLLLSQLLPVIDRWVIQRFASYSSAGVYASLYEIAIRSFSFLVFPLTQAAHPRIMRCWNEGQFAASYRIIRYSILGQFAIFVVLLGGVSFFASRITRFILGFDDPIATQMLPVLVVGGFLWQLAVLLHKPLEIAQRTGVMLSAMVAVVVLNVVACFMFIPRFGYQAAAYVLVLSAGAYVFITLCMTRFRAFRGFLAAENC